MEQKNDSNPPIEPDEDTQVKSEMNEAWLQEVKSFAQGFYQFKNNETSSTPQADLGIGPVNYKIQNPKANKVSERRIQLLDNAVKLEKSLGDYWIKIEATLMTAVFGIEDPIKSLPTAQRYAIRSKLRE